METLVIWYQLLAWTGRTVSQLQRLRGQWESANAGHGQRNESRNW